jgi:hypothetical protein
MAEIFSPPLIQAQNWQQAQRKFNEALQQMARMLNNIYSGKKIPTSRIKADAITGAEIADDQVDSEHFVAGSIDTEHLAADCVTAAKILAGTITATEMTITDLSNIANLLTVASGKIIIGADAIGSGLDGILINDGTHNRVELGEISADTYGLNIRDSSGVLWNSAGETQLVWQEVYDNILSTAATSVTISNLTGDTDHIYHIFCKFYNDYNGAVSYGLRPNNDSTGDKDYQWVRADGADVTAGEETDGTMMVLGSNDAQNKICCCWGQLHAKSGHARTLLHHSLQNVTATDSGVWFSRAGMWSNTANEITSLVFLADQTNGLGVGTHISVYRIKSF